MPTYALTDVSDEALLAELVALVATDRGTTAALLAHLAEVEARGLYLPAACSSMYAYCTRVLHLSEDAAYKRIRAARVARRFPAILDAIADGRLHLTAVVLLATHVTDANVDELVAAATHRSKAELEILVARLAPRPDMPDAVTPIAPAPGTMPLPQLVPEPVGDQPPAPPPRVMALAPERFALQVTIRQATRDKLERARALLRHRNPSGDLAEVLDRALDALLDRLEKEMFGATSRPRAAKAPSECADPRYVSNEVRRAVHERDGEQCSFVSTASRPPTRSGCCAAPAAPTTSTRPSGFSGATSRAPSARRPTRVRPEPPRRPSTVTCHSRCAGWASRPQRRAGRWPIARRCRRRRSKHASAPRSPC